MFKKLLQTSIVLALIVVILGAYTRLGDAGLGCPDWPGCYGQLIVPDAADGTKLEGYDRPLEAAKGWKEMVHRYAASTLGLVILILWFLALRGKPQRFQSMALPSFTALFVMLDAHGSSWYCYHSFNWRLCHYCVACLALLKSGQSNFGLSAHFKTTQIFAFCDTVCTQSTNHFRWLDQHQLCGTFLWRSIPNLPRLMVAEYGFY